MRYFLGVKWCSLRDNEARVNSPSSTICAESAIVESTRNASVRVVMARMPSAPSVPKAGVQSAPCVTAYLPQMTENRPESLGSHRRCQTTKLIVLQSKTPNNRGYHNLRFGNP